VPTSDGKPGGATGPTGGTLEAVIRLVVKTLDDRRVAIGPDTALFVSVKRFDSFMLLELVLRLEKTFGLSIPDDDLDRDVFGTPRAIADYLERRLQPPGHA
jgi:acyl carrier protein